MLVSRNNKKIFYFYVLIYSIYSLYLGNLTIVGGWGGIKVYPPSKIFAKLVNKNAIKHQKGVPSPKNFHNLYIPSLPKFGTNLMDPPSGFSNCVHLCFCVTCKKVKIKSCHFQYCFHLRKIVIFFFFFQYNSDSSEMFLNSITFRQGVTWSNFTWSNHLIEFFDQVHKKLSLDQKFY